MKNKARHLNADLCGNIPIKELVKPLRPPGMGSGEIATFHYGQNFTVRFWVYLYENGKGHAVFKYQIIRGGIEYAFDETFDMEGRKWGVKRRAWSWVFVCKCKRRTRHLFFGWDFSCLCRYCLGVRSSVHQATSWRDVRIAKDPQALKHLIYTAYTPYKKARVIKIYTDFLKRMLKAIRSKNPRAYLNYFKPKSVD